MLILVLIILLAYILVRRILFWLHVRLCNQIILFVELCDLLLFSLVKTTIFNNNIISCHDFSYRNTSLLPYSLSSKLHVLYQVSLIISLTRAYKYLGPSTHEIIEKNMCITFTLNLFSYFYFFLAYLFSLCFTKSKVPLSAWKTYFFVGNTKPKN
jgi:hypothetical protein